MTIIYRSVQGTDLTPDQVDGNFRDLDGRVDALEDDPPVAVSISFFETSGSNLYVHLTDLTVVGPYALPAIKWHFVGDWAAVTPYAAFDVVTVNGGVYQVNENITSAATFDPFLTDGSGNLIYDLLLTLPSVAVPIGGATDQVLAKINGADYNTRWQSSGVPRGGTTDQIPYKISNSDFNVGWRGIDEFGLTLRELADVDIAASPVPDTGAVLQWNGSDWVAIDVDGIGIEFTDISGTATPVQVRQSTDTVLGATGTVSLDPSLGDIFSVTPTGSITLNASAAPVGAQITLVVTTSGTSSYTITFGTMFKTIGSLATGTVSAKVFTVTFAGDGTNLNEVARTTAM